MTPGAVYEIAEQFTFAATHEIPGLPSTHPCHGVHMHLWTVEIVLLAAGLLPTDGHGEIVALEPLRRYVTTELESRHLNDLLVGDPTPARLAGHLAQWCRRNACGYVAETVHSVVVTASKVSRGRCVITRGQGGARPLGGSW